MDGLREKDKTITKKVKLSGSVVNGKTADSQKLHSYSRQIKPLLVVCYDMSVSTCCHDFITYENTEI